MEREMPGLMYQQAPYPHILEDLLSRFSEYKGQGRKWTFALKDMDRGQGCKGLTLVINIQGPNAYGEGRFVSVNHYMIVPAAAYNEVSWEWWLWQQVGLVEQHERMENFLVDGSRPYAPVHKPGWDPYLVTVESTDEERRTSFRGELNPDPT
jgi:hypothetical protein